MASEPLGCVISFRRGGVDARGGDVDVLLRIGLHCLKIERLVSCDCCDRVLLALVL